MTHSHKNYALLYKVYIDDETLGFVVGRSELGAMQNATKLMGFETTENFIDCYPGKFDPEYLCVEDSERMYDILEDHNMTLEYYMRLPRLEQVKISYFDFHRINSWTTVATDMNFISNIAHKFMPMLFPLTEDVRLVANYSAAPNKRLWFCKDWVDENDDPKPIQYLPYSSIRWTSS